MKHGFLLIDKPTGVTSFNVLHQIDKHFSLGRQGYKVGHGGTLDPEASGLLVAAVGQATKLLRFFLGSDKRYLAQFHLGERTTTDDATGEVIETAPWEHVTRDDVERALDTQRGHIQQIPPNFSAIHVQGKRAYDLARAGKDLALPAREATIYLNKLTACDLPNSPILGLDIACSGGTYIRSIARDLGETLGCHAHMCSLRRIQSCRFDIAQATPLAELLAATELDPFVLPCESALAHLPALTLSTKQVQRLMQGQFVDFKRYEQGVYRVQEGDDPTLKAVVEINDKIEITRIVNA